MEKEEEYTLESIPNKIANSGLITIDLEDYYTPGLRMELDIAPWLYEGMILREKDFRQYVKEHDWSAYEDAYVSVHCSEDVIIPQWAYMLLGSSLAPFAQRVVYGSAEVLETILMEEALNQADFSRYTGKRIILKGCGHLPIPPQAYLKMVSCLQPIVKSIMFGEACSTVPIYKKK
ncbi:MAG: DUF2480 family protein [Owenweeksia sp.]